MSITTISEGNHHGIGRLDILSKMLARCCVWKTEDRKLNYIKQEIVNLRGQEAVRPAGCSEHWQLGGVGLAKQSRLPRPLPPACATGPTPLWPLCGSTRRQHLPNDTDSTLHFS